MKLPLNQYRDLLATYLRSQWPRVILLAALLFGGIGLQLVNPQIVRYFLDTAQVGGSIGALLAAAALFLGLGFASQGVTVLIAYASTDVGWNATNRLRADLMRHCLSLDMPFHNAHTPGELIERIDGDVAALMNFFSRFVLLILGNLLLLVGVLAMLFREDRRIGLVFTVFALVTLAILYGIREMASPHWRGSRQASADLFGFLEERLAGIRDLRANGALDYAMRRFFDQARAHFHAQRTASVVSMTIGGVAGGLLALGSVGAVALGAYLFQTGSFTIGTVYLIVYYTGLLSTPLQVLVHQVDDLQKAGASVGRIAELRQLRPAVHDEGKKELPPGALGVEFERVWFGYGDEATNDQRPTTNDDGQPTVDHGRWTMDDGEPRTENQEPGSHDQALPPVQTGRRPVSTQHSALSTQDFAPSTQHSQRVLRDVSFKLPPGQVLGILGRTGSGKTTLTRLLFRLYDPVAGAIRLGDVDVRSVPLAGLRRRVSMVTQDVQLFHATVRDNLTFFDHSIPDQRILEALHDLGLWRWYATLPAGLDTELAAGGSGLSAGEAQLLALARVFLQDPDLVILDEASSRLDPATERLIERAIDKLLQPEDARRRTGIIIAHRLRTVQRADMIMILEDGRVKEFGRRAQLVRDPQAHFYRLLQTGLEEVLA